MCGAPLDAVSAVTFGNLDLVNCGACLRVADEWQASVARYGD